VQVPPDVLCLGRVVAQGGDDEPVEGLGLRGQQHAEVRSLPLAEISRYESGFAKEAAKVREGGVGGAERAMQPDGECGECVRRDIETRYGIVGFGRHRVMQRAGDEFQMRSEAGKAFLPGLARRPATAMAERSAQRQRRRVVRPVPGILLQAEIGRQAEVVI